MSDDEPSRSERNPQIYPEGTDIERSSGTNRLKPSSAQFVGTQKVFGPPWSHVLILTSVFFANQSIWSTEMAYASPYLHSQGLSKALTALVFLAAPISGLLVQPLVGAWADRSTSPYGRRRPVILLGSLLCGISMLGLSWSNDIARFIGGGHGLGLMIAIISFYGIDFTINAVIACDRALIIDLLPGAQQEAANLWISRTTSAGALLGFFIGHLDLRSLPFVRLLGTSQFQDLSAVVSLGLLLVHVLVALCVREKVLLKTGENTLNYRSLVQPLKQFLTFMRIYTVGLPRRIKTIGLILFLSWLGWFPFMFFGSLWISDIYLRERTVVPDQSSERERNEVATQAAARSMMYYAIVSLLTATFLPIFVAPRKTATTTPPSSMDEGRGSLSLKRLGQRVKRLDLVAMWVVGHGVFAVCLFSTIWATTYKTATILYAISGFSSALIHWAPYALLGEAILEEKVPSEVNESEPRNETSPLLSSSPIFEDNTTITPGMTLPFSASSQKEHATSDVKDNAGFVLGVANIAIVCPQFVIIALSAIIFAIFEPNRSILPTSSFANRAKHQFDSITIVFGFGGVATLLAMWITWRLRDDAQRTR